MIGDGIHIYNRNCTMQKCLNTVDQRNHCVIPLPLSEERMAFEIKCVIRGNFRQSNSFGNSADRIKY